MLDVIPTLQLAIGPVILISGVGLILLSMTNRFGRVIDRSRLLVREASHADRPRLPLMPAVGPTRARVGPRGPGARVDGVVGPVFRAIRP